MANESRRSGHTAGAFDIRLFIALLFVIYGAVLTVMGIAAGEADIAKAAGVNANLWAGLGMLIFAALFGVWAKLRPIIVPDQQASEKVSAGH